MLAGSGLGEIVDTLAEVLGKPCAVYDADDRRLAIASPEGADGMLPRLLEQPCVDDPAVAGALERAAAAVRSSLGPLPDAGVMHRHWSRRSWWTTSCGDGSR